MHNRSVANGTTNNRSALIAIIAACTVWGMSIAISKIVLQWLDPAWLVVGRFLLVVPILAFVARRTLRQALKPTVLAFGAIGYGAVTLLQNVGVANTSVSHAAIIVGALPALVAVMSVGLGHSRPTRLAWFGFLIGALGIMMVADGHGGGAHAFGDLVMLGSVSLSALFVALQPFVLRGRDATAVTAVQFLGAGLAALPVALLTKGLPAAPTAVGPVLCFLVLALVGTLLPFWLFTYGQAYVAPDIAGAFVNLEPLVGAAIGWTAFGNPFSPVQAVGVVVVLAGIVCSSPAPTLLAARFELPWRSAAISD